jgi:hypothetical protein
VSHEPQRPRTRCRHRTPEVRAKSAPAQPIGYFVTVIKKESYVWSLEDYNKAEERLRESKDKTPEELAEIYADKLSVDCPGIFRDPESPTPN